MCSYIFYRELGLPSGSVSVSFDVKNVGNVDGEEVAQLYVSDMLASMVRPAIEFAGCLRVFLKTGESKRVKFTVRADQFAFMNKDNEWVVEQGEMKVMVGGSSNRLVLEGSFHIDGSAVIDPVRRGFYAKAETL